MKIQPAQRAEARCLSDVSADVTIFLLCSNNVNDGLNGFDFNQTASDSYFHSGARGQVVETLADLYLGL